MTFSFLRWICSYLYCANYIFMKNEVFFCIVAVHLHSTKARSKETFVFSSVWKQRLSCPRLKCLHQVCHYTKHKNHSTSGFNEHVTCLNNWLFHIIKMLTFPEILWLINRPSVTSLYGLCRSVCVLEGNCKYLGKTFCFKLHTITVYIKMLFWFQLK